MNKITRDETEHGVEYVRADEAQAEVLEQCRIIAMGAEREDALRAELTRLKASIALDWMAKNARELGLDYDTPLSAFVRSSDEDKAEVMERVIDKAIEAQKEKIGCVNHDCDKCKAQPAPVQHDECVVCGDKVRVIPRPWVGLTETEVEAYDSWADFQVGCGRQTLFDMVRDIEAKLKEKNT
jgi:hypothetical protein